VKVCVCPSITETILSITLFGGAQEIVTTAVPERDGYGAPVGLHIYSAGSWRRYKDPSSSRLPRSRDNSSDAYIATLNTIALHVITPVAPETLNCTCAPGIADVTDGLMLNDPEGTPIAAQGIGGPRSAPSPAASD